MPSRLSSAWATWVSFWDEREHPRSMALVRIFLGVCLVYDFLHIFDLGLVTPLFGVAEAGGLSDAMMRDTGPLYYQWMPGTVTSGRILHATLVLSSLSLLMGFFTRTSALVLLIAWSQFSFILPYSDRGIDALCRLILTILVFARSGDWLSLDAMIRTGNLWGDGSSVPAWPRKLVILQLVTMYFSAGFLKNGATWWPGGSFAALYFAMQDPAVAAFDFGFTRHQPFFFFLQFGTASTMLYQLTYPTVLLLMWWRRNPGRGGRVAAFANRYRVEFLWIAIGAVFHLILAIVMNLGIFPWAMLALYPAWLHPDEWVTLSERVRTRWRRWRDPGATEATSESTP